MRFFAVEGERIVARGQCQPENLNSYARLGRIVMFSAADSEGCWWDTVQQTLKPKTELTGVSADVATIVADGQDEATITGIPEGAWVAINGSDDPQTIVADGATPVVVKRSTPGMIHVAIDHARHFELVIAVEATAQ